ncbi:MAG: hypothetical protein KTR31_37155 [Myxococcales bacterium]|nr:hypothetical protein [Myxococcales bacterium]
MIWWSCLCTSGSLASAGVTPSDEEEVLLELDEALAGAVDGDTVVLRDGGYIAGSQIRASITLRGEGDQTRLVSPGGGVPALRVVGAEDVVVRDLVLDGDGGARSLLIDSSSVVLERVTFRQGAAPYDGGHLYVRNSEVSGSDLTFVNPVAVAGNGAHVYAIDSTLDLKASVFRNGTAGGLGGALHLRNTHTVLEGCSLVGNVAAAGGGVYAIGGLDTTTTLFDVQLLTNSAIGADGIPADGGGAYLTGGTPRVELARVEGNEAARAGGGVLLVGEGAITASHFEANVAAGGGAVALRDPSHPQIWTNTFRGNTASDLGGTLGVEGSGRFDVAGNRICATSATDGGTLAVQGSEDLAGTFRHNVVSDTAATASGSSVWVRTAQLTMEQNTVVGATSAFRGVVAETGALATVRNNAFVDHDGPVLFAQTDSVVEAAWNLLHAAERTVDAEGDDPVLADPQLAAGDLDCANPLVPAAGTPMVDGGDPDRFDADGTRSDLGATGGTDAHRFYDLDGDGVVAGDCAPFDPDSTEPSGEVPADRIDQDCDGSDLCYVDADGDGVGSADLTPAPSCDDAGVSFATGDCDDADPGRAATCDDTAPPPDSWFCGSAGAGGSLWLPVVCLALVRRRTS